jgi:hypothetical protein
MNRLCTGYAIIALWPQLRRSYNYFLMCATGLRPKIVLAFLVTKLFCFSFIFWFLHLALTLFS